MCWALCTAQRFPASFCSRPPTAELHSHGNLATRVQVADLPRQKSARLCTPALPSALREKTVWHTHLLTWQSLVLWKYILLVYAHYHLRPFFHTQGKNCVVLGDSNIVGTPLAAMLRDKGAAAVTICHRRSYKE